MSDAKDTHGKKDEHHEEGAHGHEKKTSPASKVWGIVWIVISIGLAAVVLVTLAFTFLPMTLDAFGAGALETGNAMKRVGSVFAGMPSGLRDFSTWLSQMIITVTRILFPFIVVGLIGKYAYDNWKNGGGGGGHH